MVCVHDVAYLEGLLACVEVLVSRYRLYYSWWVVLHVNVCFMPQK